MVRKISQRKLAAVLAADVVGYSSLMSENEPETLAQLQNVFRNIIQPAIADSRGTIIKTMGDGYLVEFSSASDAISCATRWQSNLENWNRKNISEINAVLLIIH